MGKLVGRLVFIGLDDAFVQQAHRRIDFPFLPLVEDDAEHFPDVAHALEVVALVPEDVGQFDDAPALKLLQAGADIGAGDAKHLDDVVGVERPGGDVEQRVGLGNGAVDPPARPHFAPMENELLLDG